MKKDYSDIINRPVHEPDPIKHPRMDNKARAAQFAPFAALTGYDRIIEETQSDFEGRVLNETVFEDIDDI